MTQAGFTISGTAHPICPVMLGDARLASLIADDMLKLGKTSCIYSPSKKQFYKIKNASPASCLKQWFSHFVIRSVCDRFLLPSRSQRKSPHSSPDLCSSHWRGHWSYRRCLRTDRQEAWCHFLMSETQLAKLWTIRVRFKLHIIAKQATAISEGQRIFVYFQYWQNKWLSLWLIVAFLQQPSTPAIYQRCLDFFQLRHVTLALLASL